MLGQEKKGWLATSGSRLFETHRASHTSNYVRQAEAIGLVPFGQTNAPEFGFKILQTQSSMAQQETLGTLNVHRADQVEELLLQFHQESFL